MVKRIIAYIICALKHAKNDIMTHDHDTNHGACLFLSKDTYKNVTYVEAVGLILIRPNRGADKTEPFIRFLGAHHTLPYSSVEVQFHFNLKLVEVCEMSRPQLVGGASEDVNLLII